MIDLHCHSTASDGEYRPAVLVEMAVQAGLSAIALTDHDSTDGLEEFMAAGKSAGLHTIPGVELSCTADENAKVHIVGLGLDWKCQVLQEKLEEIRRWREERNLAIIDRLRELGMGIDLDEVRLISRQAGGEEGVIGRPHIANAMVKHGYCANVKAAFEKYLGNGRAAYVPRRTLHVCHAIELLHRAGAVTVWAHSATSIKGNRRLRRIAEELHDYGLDAMEVIYPEFTPAETVNVRRVAEALGLKFSGGTDFHGARTSPGISLGVGRGGEFLVPDDFLVGLGL